MSFFLLFSPWLTASFGADPNQTIIWGLRGKWKITISRSLSRKKRSMQKTLADNFNTKLRSVDIESPAIPAKENPRKCVGPSAPHLSLKSRPRSHILYLILPRLYNYDYVGLRSGQNLSMHFGRVCTERQRFPTRPQHTPAALHY